MRKAVRILAFLALFCGSALRAGEPPAKTIVIAQISDTHIGLKQAPKAVENLERVVALVNGHHPDAVVVTGDIGESTGARDRAREILSRLSAKVYFVPGNHDVSADTVSQWRREAGPDYYEFRVGNALFLVLDSELLGNYEARAGPTPAPLSHQGQEESRKMLQWLEARAQERQKERATTPVFVVQHIPLPEGTSESSPFLVAQEPYAGRELELLHRLGVRHVFAGHWHAARVFAADGLTMHVAPSTAWAPSGQPLGFALHSITAAGEVATAFFSLSGQPFDNGASAPAAAQGAEAPLSISNTALPKATLRQNYFFEFKARGGAPPFHWQVVSGTLPPGLTLDAAAGRIAGAPTAVGESGLTVKVSDASQPPQTALREFVLRVVAPLTVEWKIYPRVDGDNAVRGAVVITNGTDDAFDMTFLAVAVNQIGKAFALGYQHFTLTPESTSPPIEFASTLPAGGYVVHVDAVAEVPPRNAIYRARRQTSAPLSLTGVP